MNIALITARGGSKGLPRKNILELSGLPLIAWTIKAAQQARSIDAVYVSTEDDEIATVSRGFGAEVIVRPDELAQDASGSEPVIAHALMELVQQGVVVHRVCLLQPTSPMRSHSHIDEAFTRLENKGAHCVLSVFEPSHSAAKAYQLKSDGSITGLLFDDAPYTPRQTLPVTYQPNGAIYWFLADQFLAHQKIPRTQVFPYVMDEYHSIDIDTIEDFKNAQARLEKG